MEEVAKNTRIVNGFNAVKNMEIDTLLENANKLTPIEIYNKIYFKRDDYFRPFNDIDINGGKVRQCILLINEMQNEIRTKYNSTVATACGMDSPQGLIVTYVAGLYGFKSVCAYGTSRTAEALLENYKLAGEMKRFGADVRVVTKLGYDSVVYSALKKIQQTEPFYIIKFGLALENHQTAIIDSIANQVQNLPDELDNLIIPAGSCIHGSCILLGLKKYNKKVKNIYIVQVAGYDRTETISKIIYNDNIDLDIPEYNFIKYTKHQYHHKLKTKITDEFVLDNIYESKAYDWLLDNIDYKNEKTLFWVVGNCNSVR